MPVFEIHNPRTYTRDSDGNESRTRAFRSTMDTSDPPIDAPEIPRLLTPHPTEPGLLLRRYGSEPVGMGDGWVITCYYDRSATSGGNRPRPASTEVGTWRWNESVREVVIRCPVAELTRRAVVLGNDQAEQDVLYYATKEQTVTADMSELTIEVVDWSPSLNQRRAIRERIGDLHKIGDDPTLYKYRGCDTQPLGEAIRGDNFYSQIVRYIHRWDGDDGSWPASGPNNAISVGDNGDWPELVFPNVGGELLYRPGHATWATAPSRIAASAGVPVPPTFHIVHTAYDDPNIYEGWRALPGMEYVQI